jgi:hypothetical protein
MSSSIFFCQYQSVMALYAHITSGGWTIDSLVAAVQRHRLTPSIRTTAVRLSITCFDTVIYGHHQDDTCFDLSEWLQYQVKCIVMVYVWMNAVKRLIKSSYKLLCRFGCWCSMTCVTCCSWRAVSLVSWCDKSYSDTVEWHELWIYRVKVTVLWWKSLLKTLETAASQDKSWLKTVAKKSKLTILHFSYHRIKWNLFKVVFKIIRKRSLLKWK